MIAAWPTLLAISGLAGMFVACSQYSGAGFIAVASLSLLTWLTGVGCLGRLFPKKPTPYKAENN